MKHEVNALGKQCPIPVVMTKKVIDGAAIGDEITVLVDNETAVKNLSRLANKTGCSFVSEKLEEKKYKVKLEVQTQQKGEPVEEEEFVCDTHKKVTVAVISSNVMGNGDDELGGILIKGFLYALSQMETHPDTILFLPSHHSTLVSDLLRADNLVCPHHPFCNGIHIRNFSHLELIHKSIMFQAGSAGKDFHSFFFHLLQIF